MRLRGGLVGGRAEKVVVAVVVRDWWARGIDVILICRYIIIIIML